MKGRYAEGQKERMPMARMKETVKVDGYKGMEVRGLKENSRIEDGRSVCVGWVETRKV